MKRILPLVVVAGFAVGGAGLASAWAQAQPAEGQRVRQPRGQGGQGGGQRAMQPAERRPGQGGGGGGRAFGGGMGGGFGGGMFGGGDATISAGDFKRYGDKLGLNDDQRAASKALLEGYRAQISTIDDEVSEKRREAMEKMRETRDPAAFEGMRTAAQEATAKKAKVETEFFADVKSLLTPEQEGKWEGMERMHRRDVGMRRGRLSGERMDVVRLVEDLKLEGKDLADVQEILGIYEEQLDRELTARAKVYADVEGKVGELFRNQDMEGAQKELEKAREAGLKVREINKKFARQVQDALSGEKKDAMALAVKKAAHPEVYRETQLTRQLTAAEKLTGLTEEQKKSLAELREKTARDTTSINDKLAAAQEEMELTVTMADIGARFRGEGGNDAMGDLRQQRRDLETAATESLKKILTEDQMNQLPKPERREGGGRGRGGQQRDEGGDEEI